MNWHFKALLQRFFGFIPFGQQINNYTLTFIKLRKPIFEQIKNYKIVIERHINLLAQVGYTINPGIKVLELGTGKNLIPSTILALL